MSKQNFAPLAEAAEQSGDQISWAVTLPDYAPVEEVGVDLSRLGKLAHLGGFDRLHVGNHAGEVTKSAPVMASVDEHGQATAGLGGAVVKAEVLEASVSPDLTPGTWDDMLHAYQWPDGRLSLNINELDERLVQAGDSRSPEAWAKNLNRVLTQGTRQITRKHLFSERGPKEKYGLVAPWILPSFSLLQAISLRSPVHLISGATYLVGGAAFIHATTLIRGRSHGLPTSDLRRSLFPGIQLDRILAVEALSRTSPLIKDMRSER